MRFLKFSIIFAMTLSSIWAQGAMSLYSDIKAHSIGEVITVLVVESASARQESNVNTRSNASVNADATLAGTFAEFLPVFGASSVTSTDIDNSNGSKQEDRLSGKITVSIIEETDAGLLRIEGERTVEVNGEENVMKLKGLVRPRDIRTDNTIYSYNIADAQIIYRQAGVVNAIASPATISKTIAVSLVLGLIGLSIAGVGI
mgnify:CR=1 FL=1